jgi:hypothetical protein
MAPSAVALPNVLTDPGYLFIAPLASTLPTNTVAGSIFTDAWPGAWLPFGATEKGSEFDYSIDVKPIEVAEFLDPVAQRTVGRSGSMAFNLASWTLSNYRRALNGGVAALTATSGSGATALYTLNPPAPGSEVRAMIGWESLDNTVRLVLHQTIQGGEIKSAFRKAPDFAVIPCTFNMEVPSGGQPFTFWSAGASRA